MSKVKTKKKKVEVELVKVDLACGQNKQEGFTGIDIADTDDADIVHDLSDYPWPFEDDSVDETFCSHYVEHTYPVGGQNDGLIAFMNEQYRILKDGGKARIIHPFLKGDRAFQDPTHTRFIPDVTWWYFNREWRELQKLDHYPITANFEVANIQSDWLDPWNLKSIEAQQYGLRHHWNVVGDLVVDLVAHKSET